MALLSIYVCRPESGDIVTAEYPLCLLAVVSSPLFAVLAIALGHVAHHKPGFILGYGALLLWLAVTAFPRFRPTRTGLVLNTAAAVGSLRTINAAELTYATTYKRGFSPTLAALGPSSGNAEPSALSAGLVPGDLANGKHSTYTFDYKPGPAEAGGRITAYTVSARPTAGRHPNFFTDQSRIIRRTDEDRPATLQDRPID
jgi:hypothetical protein